MWLLIALLLLVVWGVGLLAFHLGALIHLVLLGAVVAFVWHWVSRRTAAK